MRSSSGIVAALSIGAAGLLLAACSSGSSSSPATTTTKATTTTMASTTTSAPTTTSQATTTTAAGPPCTREALQAALPSGTTIDSPAGSFRCEGGYAGAELNITTPGGGITAVTLFKAQGNTWVKIDRTDAVCAAVPASIHFYCTVS